MELALNNKIEQSDLEINHLKQSNVEIKQSNIDIKQEINNLKQSNVKMKQEMSRK